MRVEIVPYEALCELKVFSVNGKDADYDDFVSKYDHDEENAPDYGCGDMRCDEKDPSPEVLAKYGITLAEYHEIVEHLCSVLDFGCCGWCV